MPTDSASGRAAAPWGRDLLLLSLGFGALNFFLLGSSPLANPDEARYAEIPREMLVRGDWVMPRLNDVPYFEKPPLVYWTVAVSRVLFGNGEFAARLTPALFGLGGVLLAYAAARRLFGRAAGLDAALVLGTSLLYFALSRVLLLDMAVSVLMSAALFCFILGVREPAPSTGSGQAGARRRWLFLGLYAAAALATLAKGLIGFLVPGAVMFFWLLIFNQWHRLRPMYLPSGLALFLAIAAPWHVLAAQRHPEWAQFYFVHEHWTRFTTTAHSRTEPWWFFLPIVLLGLFPWVGFLGGAVRDALRGDPCDGLVRRAQGPAIVEGLRASWARRRENADAWFLVTWAVFVLLFFSKSQSKLIPYILPVFPPLAVLIGAWLAKNRGEPGAPRLRAGFGIFAFACGVLGAALIVAVLKPGFIADPEQARVLRPFGFAMAGVVLVGGVAARWVGKHRGGIAGVGAIVTTMAAFCVLLLFAVPALQRPSTRELAAVARERVQPADRVYHYWAFFHDFVYYTERPVGLVSYTDELQVQFLDPAERARRFIDDAELRRQWAGPGRVWLVVRKRDMKHEKAVFTDPAFRYHLIAETRAHSLFSNQP